MADRYWVGGTGDWDASTTTHWSASSGGAGGQSVPTSSDNVYIDANSGTGTIKVTATAPCLNLDFSGYSGIFTFLNAYPNIYGNLNFGSTVTFQIGSGVGLLGLVGSGTIRSNGGTFPVYLGIEGNYSLYDNLSLSNVNGLLIYSGTFNTNNFNVSVVQFSMASGGSIILGSSVISVSSTWVSNYGSITANTSTIILTGSNFSGGNHTFNNVWISKSSGEITVRGSNTYNNFKADGTGAYIIRFIDGTNQTVSSINIDGSAGKLITLTGTGTAGWTISDTTGTNTITYCNISYSTANGGATWNSFITSGHNVDGGNNVGWNFYSNDRFWVGGTDVWNSTAGLKWSEYSGGIGGATVPTSLNNVYFDANSGSGTVGFIFPGISPEACNNLDFTGFTGIFGRDYYDYLDAGDLIILGDLTLGSGMTFKFAPEGRYIIFKSTSGIKYITTNGVIIPGEIPIKFDGIGGNWKLNDALVFNNIFDESFGGVFVTNGTFDLNNQNLTAKNLDVSSTMNFTSSLITLGSRYYALNISGAINAGTSTIKLNNSDGIVFSGGNKTYYNVLIDRGSNTGNISVTGSNTFNSFIDNGTESHSLIFASGTTNIFSNFNVGGSSGKLVTLQSSVSGSPFTLSKSSGNVLSPYLSIKDSIATGGASWYAPRSINVSGNTGWLFKGLPFTDPTNAYISDGIYATVPATDGTLEIMISKDGGLNYTNALSKTFDATEQYLTYGAGATELWGTSLNGDSVDDTDFRVKIVHGYYEQVYKTFGFSIAPSTILTGLEIGVEAKFISGDSLIYIDNIHVKTYYGSSVLPIQAGSQAYASDGRKNGEGVGAGTGVMVFYDGSGWKTCDTATTVQA